MQYRVFFFMIVLFSSLPLMGCSPDGGVMQAKDDVRIQQAYARATPAGMQVGAVFMTLENDGDRRHALVSAASNVADTVELHEHVHKDGMMQMRQVSKIDIPAGGKTVLKPGGYHIMVIGLKHPLTSGANVPVTLTFADGTALHVDAPVKDIGLGMKRPRADEHR